MGLLIPDPGMLIWMIIIFGVVFFILAKYGFPVIIKMVEERKDYIDKSLEAARVANEQMAHVKAESEEILAKAHKEQAQILKDATNMRNRIIKDAEIRAQEVARKALEETRQQIMAEKESAINDIRQNVAVLSVNIAEKILKKNLQNENEQLEMINQMIDEMISADNTNN